MVDAYKTLGFVVIAALYIGIGLMAARGTICIVRKVLRPKSEQVFYAIALILVATMYLVFVAYFEATTARQLEATMVAVFVVISLLGMRLSFALIVGYSLHGLWDLLHELQAHGGHSPCEPGRLTSIPLAYGLFCAAFDFAMAVYFYRRRVDWSAARKSNAMPGL